MFKSKFIVVDGLEGAGKSTALQSIENFLNQNGVLDVQCCREPGGTELGESIRSLIKDPSLKEVVDPRTELLLMYASRIQLVENVIKPALAAGRWVLCDRFYYSTFAYQGGGRGLDMNLIQSVHDAALGEFTPDATIYMDVEPKIGLSRAMGRGELDRFELEKVEFFEKTRQQYLKMAEDCSEISIVDASGTKEQVTEQINTCLQNLELF